MTITPIVALDVSTTRDALRLVNEIGEGCRFYKVGSELFTAEGPEVVDALRERGNEVFLDLKFHDIPNTVRGAVLSAASIGVSLLTVHLSGGRAMLEAAAEAASAAPSPGPSRCRVFGVSVLTSLDAPGLGEAWGRAEVTVETEVLRLARLARDAGLAGVVCSAHEADAVRREYGPSLDRLVPGIRLASSAPDDQARAATPLAAARAGATHIVVGRTVTRASDPGAAMERLRAELREAAG